MVNEKRLISLDEALKATHSEIYWTESQQAAVRSFLVQQPKVDAVEVVRCKYCKHWHEGTGWCDKHSHFVDRLGDFCYPEESGDWKEFDADYFCKDGERKEINENKSHG